MTDIQVGETTACPLMKAIDLLEPIRRDRVRVDGTEHVDHAGIELCAGVASELGERVRMRASDAVWPIVNHGVVGIGHADDPGTERVSLPFRPCG